MKRGFAATYNNTNLLISDGGGEGRENNFGLEKHRNKKKLHKSLD